MRRFRLLPVSVAIVAGLFSSIISRPAAAQSDVAVDFLAVPGPIVMRGVSYRLAWSSRPSPSYVKQEYLPESESSERVGRMVMVELVADGLDPKAAAAAKIRELKARKASDPSVNYAIIQNAGTGEVLLDFTLSSTLASGEGVSEWNGHRYAPYTAPGGGRGVVLLALSDRAFGEGRVAFFKALKAQRLIDIQALAAAPIPKPTLPP